MADILLLMLDQMLQGKRAKQKAREEDQPTGPLGPFGPDDVRARGLTGSAPVGVTFSAPVGITFSAPVLGAIKRRIG